MVLRTLLGTSRPSDFISKGNSLRNSRDWEGAAKAYRAALKEDPSNAPIWVQLGHALKESGQLRDAEIAYRKSIELDPNVADTHLQLGHALKLQGALDEAKMAYETALHLEPSNDSARLESTAISELLGGGPIALEDRYSPSILGKDKCFIVFDCSDLVHYFRDNRLPTGIQRVQMNIIGSAAAASGQGCRIVFFNVDDRSWREISILDFQRLVNVAQRVDSVSATAWEAIRNQICGTGAKSYFFSQGDSLVNLGTSWWINDYFFMIRNLKNTHNIRYIPFIHDCIPLITPEYCSVGLVKQFRAWLYGVFRHSDGYLVNSRSTASDLVRTASLYGFDIPEPGIVRLDGDMRTDGHVSAARSADSDLVHLFQRERLPIGASFVLMVSTLEARKNHILALRIWDRMMSELGETRTPYLFCIGKQGWHFHETRDFLASRKSLLRRVRFISNLSDGVLEGLYSRCVFTLYPSHYEGWGLPITESLCYGKAVVASRNSSLPEAGGEFCDYFEPGSLNDAYEKVARLAVDSDYRASREQNIKTKFKARPWSEMAQEVIAGVEQLRNDDRRPFVSGVLNLQLGAVYILAPRNSVQAGQGCIPGEDLRIGPDWHHCENFGVWTGGREARLVFGAAQSPLCDCILYLGVGGNARKDVSVTVSCPDLGREGAFDVAVNSNHDLIFSLGDVPANGQELNIIISCHEFVDLAEETEGLDRRKVGVAVRWVALCERNDLAGRLNVMETTRMTRVKANEFDD